MGSMASPVSEPTLRGLPLHPDSQPDIQIPLSLNTQTMSTPPAAYFRSAITDDASPFALRSTRNHPRDGGAPLVRQPTTGSLLARVGGRGAAGGQRPRRQAALGAAAVGALATTTASSAATRSMGSARPAPLATPSATTDARPVPPR